MKSFILASGLVATLSLLTHSAIAQPVITGVYPSGAYQFQSTNALAFSATSSAGIANVSVTLTATTLFGVQGFPQTYTSSSGLTISGTVNSEDVKAPLNTNVLYTAKIVVTDVNSLSTTVTNSFDTISPAYTWEARDWDYTSNSVAGLFIDNPQTNAYAGLASTASSDYYSLNAGSGSSSYRPQGLETEGASDTPRLAYSPYTTNQDFDVGYNNGGNWANYTRHYPPGSYNVFIRASDGNGPQANAGDIQSVSGNATFGDSGANYFSTKSTGWQTYGWYALIDGSNQPAVLTIPNDGTASTLRMTIDGGNCNENFFMLLPINTNAPVGGDAYITNSYPNGAYQFQQTNTFNGTLESTNGIMTIVAEVTGTPLSGSPFVQTLTPSSGLTVTGSSPNQNVSFALSTDTVYSVTFLMTDGNGNNSSSTLNFDTISPNYYTWEAEDYDYGGGQFFDNPQTNDYYGDAGEANVDAFCSSGPVNANAYQRGVGPIFANDQGDLNVEANGDVPRVAYLNTTNPISLQPYVDYDVGFTAGGQWANYTRHYPAGIYNIYVRAADGGGSTSDAGTISLLTGGYQTTSQTLSQLGSFSVPTTGNWQKYEWCPLLNAAGYPARFEGSNTVIQTLRMSFVNANCNLNCYMLVPANLNNNPPPFVGNFTPDGTAIFQPSNTVTFTANSSVGITASGIALYLNGVKQSSLTLSGNSFAMNVSCPIQTNQLYTAVITLSDSAGSTSYTNSFATFSASDYQFEAEDYDYTSGGVTGQYVDNPQVDSYAGLAGSSGIDLLEADPNAPSRGFTYRPASAANTGYDIPDTGSGDLPRAQFTSAGKTDYSIGSFGIDSWANYTRHYPAGTYNIVGRFAEGAAISSATMSILTGGYQTSTQTTNFLGTFVVPLGGWSSWEWSTLVDKNGNPAKVTLDGSLHTLQLAGGNANEVNVNFFLLAPTSPEPPVSTLISGGNIHLSFFTQTGWKYQVEYKTNLTDPTWTPLGTALTGNNTVQTVSDSLSAGHRFYIVAIQPTP